MRIKSIAQRKHKKLLNLAKGYKQARSKRIKAVGEAVRHAGAYAFHGRKLKKRNLRTLWIIRISAALKNEGLSYSKFTNLLKKEKIELDRKILSYLAVKEKDAFLSLVKSVTK